MPTFLAPVFERIWHPLTARTALARVTLETAVATSLVAAAGATAALCGADMYAFKVQVAVVVNGFAAAGLLLTLWSANSSGMAQPSGQAVRPELLFGYLASIRVPALTGCILLAIATRRTWSDPVVESPWLVLGAATALIAGLWGASLAIAGKGDPA